MIKLTSDLDYKLTKKRLLMMGKNFSRTRSNSLKIFIAPVLFCIALLFCTDTFENSGLEPEIFKGQRDKVYYKADIILYTQIDEDSNQIRHPVLYFSAPEKLYTEKGELFTGSRIFYDRMTRNPGWEEFIEDGIIMKTVRMNESLIQLDSVASIHYEYKNGHYTTITRYNRNDEVLTRMELKANSFRNYGAENQLIGKVDSEVINGIRWFYENAWDPNGQPIYESSRDSTYDNGYSIFYNQEGDTVRLRRWENDVLIEEINNEE